MYVLSSVIAHVPGFVYHDHISFASCPMLVDQCVIDVTRRDVDGLVEVLQQQLLDRDTQLAVLQRGASTHGPAGHTAAAQSDDRTPTAQLQAPSSQRYAADATAWSDRTAGGPASTLRPQAEAQGQRRMSQQSGAMLHGSSTNPLFVEAHASDCTPASSVHAPIPLMEFNGGVSDGNAEGQSQAALIAVLQRQVAELQALRATVTQPPSLEQSAYTPTSAVPANPRQSFSNQSGCAPSTAQSAARVSATTWQEQACSTPLGVGVTDDSGRRADVAPSGGGRSDAEAQAPVHLLLFDAGTNTSAPSVDAGSNTAGRNGCQTEGGSGGGNLHEGDVSIEDRGAPASRCTQQVITQPCTILLLRCEVRIHSLSSSQSSV